MLCSVLWNVGKLLAEYTAQHLIRDVLAAVRTWNLTIHYLDISLTEGSMDLILFSEYDSY
jgi:hypothetical protein